MADFNIRADSVNVEQIMEQIRARIREKRGVDYTEQQIRELAAVKLERFLDPKGVRSDLLEQFRRVQPPYEPPELPNFAFEEATLYESHRGAIRFIRRLLNPLLKLFFNPNPLIQALNIQARLNTMNAEREARREAARRASDQLYYELIHNLVLETTRLGIEVKNLKMRVESVGSRLEFNERRARALESVVVYKAEQAVSPQSASLQSVSPQSVSPQSTSRQSTVDSRQSQSQPRPHPEPQPQPAPGAPATQGQQPGPEGPGQRSRRRRRRRGRRGRGPVAPAMAGQGQEQPARTDLDTVTGAESQPHEPELPHQPDDDESDRGGEPETEG